MSNGNNDPNNDSFDLLTAFKDLEAMIEDTDSSRSVLRAPMGYPGGKSKLATKIADLLPNSRLYVEPFGGAASVLLAKRPSRFEVYNDRYGGVVAFYRCLRDEDKMNRLCSRLQLTVMAKEEWNWCKETWESCHDDVERAARWYYCLVYSFGHIMRNWGRSTTSGSVIAGKIQERITEFPAIHQRLQNVQIENQDWYTCMMTYDSHDTVFYLDPPYYSAYKGTYKHELTQDDHKKLLDTIFQCEGYCALSSYPNKLYDGYPWDHVHEFDVHCSAKAAAFTEANNKANLENVGQRGRVTEYLYIKEWGRKD